MRVLVFDIDGTLTATTKVDGDFFRAAVQAVLPEAAVGPLGGFSEHTDTAILQEVCAALPGRHYGQVQPAVERHFIAGLREALEARPEAFLPVPGAPEILEETREAGWTPAIATGGWRPSAELKLAAAGISTADAPLATSSEETRRVDIIRLAVAKATADAEPEAVVYVGDGIWDVRACRELSIGFVGRSSRESSQRLMQHGARASVPDFSEPEALFRPLADVSSLVPKPPITR